MIFTLRIISMIFAALALIPAGAHLFSMASKLQLGGTEYLASQRAYDGWNIFAVVVIGALISTLALTFTSFRSQEPFVLPGLSFLCLAFTQVIFWSFTYPANKATENWNLLPDNWEVLRSQWEWSHAGNATLNATALVLLVLSSTKH